MTEIRENTFDGYVSAADEGRGLFGPGRSRRCKLRIVRSTEKMKVLGISFANI